jgi:hypothetical protein
MIFIKKNNQKNKILWNFSLKNILRQDKNNNSWKHYKNIIKLKETVTQ